MAFPKYESYKDSGVDWLGEIPSHWSIRRNKYLFAERDERRGSDEIKHYALSKSLGLVPHSDATDKEARADSLDNYKKFQLDDLVMNKMQAWNGIFGYATSEGVVSPDYTVFKKIDDINVKFYEFLYKTSLYIGQFLVESRGMGDAFKRLHTPRFGAIHAIYPPKDEQDRIVNFLTHKTAEIDEAITKKQRLIELLQEQKTILINQAVTKGLNPKVPMRDSGVEWIGEIPEHWEVIRNRYLFQEQNERSLDGSEIHLSMSQKLGLIPSEELEDKTLQSESYEGAKLCTKGDIVLNRLKAHLGVFSVSPCNGLVSPDYSVFRLKNSEMIPDYFEHLFKTSIYIAEFNRRVKGIVVGFYRLYTDAFNDIPCLCPPAQEQAEIRDWILAKNQDVKVAEQAIRTEIEKMLELKTVLISSAVTGKIKV